MTDMDMPLPEPEVGNGCQCYEETEKLWFTADQMRAYAAAAVARERARCSDICDQNASCEGIAQKCAAAIRRG